MAVAGIDVGARYAKAVVLQDGRVTASGSAVTGFDPAASARSALDAALAAAGLDVSAVRAIVATGAGAETVTFATGRISMVGAVARAGVWYFSDARTVVDVGAEDARAAKTDERGTLLDFVVNDRCAAGAGAFIEAMTRALELRLDEMGPLSLESTREIPMNAQCVIFGESEVVSLIHNQTSKADIARAVYDAMADRVSSMVRRIGVNPAVVLVGGVARDVGFVSSLSRRLGVELRIPENPEFAGAVGAALSAQP